MCAPLKMENDYRSDRLARARQMKEKKAMFQTVSEAISKPIEVSEEFHEVEISHGKPVNVPKKQLKIAGVRPSELKRSISFTGVRLPNKQNALRTFSFGRRRKTEFRAQETSNQDEGEASHTAEEELKKEATTEKDSDTKEYESNKPPNLLIRKLSFQRIRRKKMELRMERLLLN